MATVKHFFKPEEAQFLAANFPQYVKNNGSNFPVAGLAYDGGSTDEGAFWQFKAANYGSGSLTLKIRWYAASATSGNVVWGAQIAAITPNSDTQNVETDALATASTVTDANLGNTKQVHEAEITISNLDSLAADDEVWLHIYRDASDTGTDTMAGDAILIGVELSYSDS